MIADQTAQRDGAPATGRVVALDALRGLALLGILLVNIRHFASAFYGVGLADPLFSGFADRLVEFLVGWLLGLKFYLIFSLLFGYSVALQIRAADRAGVPFAPRFLRRQASLWLIGALHAVLLFHGDILTTYAVLGVVLMLVRKRSDDSLLRLATWLIGGTVFFWTALGSLLAAFPPEFDQISALERAEAAMQAYRAAPMTVIAQHVRELSWVSVTIATVQAPCALAMFMVGLVMGRRRVLEQPDRHRAQLRRLAHWGLLLGLLGSAPSAFCNAIMPDSSWAPLALALSLLSAPLLAGAYVAIALLFFQSRSGAAVRDALAPAGRMALSNYLAQSLVCSLVFHAYGFGLVGQVAPLPALMLGVLIFLVQLALSRWWMQRFGRGPLEAILPRATPAGLPAIAG
ncbi:DUF418 domain-containing protein [Bosea caraganae]|uniref:DUF418 domain-containing protein n=1 Tax=Bosea caraganae TaxID=2763117 RepID=A0A370LCW6_9HYPH|nr:DUF418 domain-containing protein [Bosea caraganae]RDJ27657.1 DUF418 domain-containing protein [Bosea caraganae]RDJ29670.1 DUF418 domain-containing protein [Bosea caraganae]